MKIWAYFLHNDLNATPIQRINKIAGLLLILLSITVSIPLTILTLMSGGGSWGFGVIGIPILLPLSGYIFFGIAGIINPVKLQRSVFIASHVITITVGIACLLIFPLYPVIVLMVPILLAVMGIISRKRFTYFLLVMMALAVVANFVLLKWELDFGRTLPLFQLFQFSP